MFQLKEPKNPCLASRRNEILAHGTMSELSVLGVSSLELNKWKGEKGSF